MNKNEAWVKVGSSVAAAMISYLVISLIASQMEIFWKVVAVSIVGGVAFIIAFWGGNKTSQDVKQLPKTEAGTNIKTKGGVTLEGVAINSSVGNDVKVASGIEAEKDVVIKDISVGK